jgi:hypothetical protein
MSSELLVIGTLLTIWKMWDTWLVCLLCLFGTNFLRCCIYDLVETSDAHCGNSGRRAVCVFILEDDLCFSLGFVLARLTHRHKI